MQKIQILFYLIISICAKNIDLTLEYQCWEINDLSNYSIFLKIEKVINLVSEQFLNGALFKEITEYPQPIYYGNYLPDVKNSCQKLLFQIYDENSQLVKEMIVSPSEKPNPITFQIDNDKGQEFTLNEYDWNEEKKMYIYKLTQSTQIFQKQNEKISNDRILGAVSEQRSHFQQLEREIAARQQQQIKFRQEEEERRKNARNVQQNKNSSSSSIHFEDKVVFVQKPLVKGKNNISYSKSNSSSGLHHKFYNGLPQVPQQKSQFSRHFII